MIEPSKKRKPGPCSFVVFGVTGFLLGREAYFNLFSLHFASEGLQLALLILSPVIGAIVGALLAPLAQSLFEGELEIVERTRNTGAGAAQNTSNRASEAAVGWEREA